MNLFQVTVLATIQGLTEFLPVSSSGHLVILQKIFGFSKAPVAFDVFLHLGTVLAILAYFKKRIKDLIVSWRRNLNLAFLLLIGSFPAGMIGILFKKQLESTFNSLSVVGISYLLSAILLFSTYFIKVKSKKRANRISWIDSLFVGMFQALALLPGVSRSGSTIAAGLWRGLLPSAAFYFSFLLAIPTILGATALEIKELVFSDSFGLGVLGMVISGVIGYYTLNLLEKTLDKKRCHLFGWYCLILAILLIIYSRQSN
jgi:undecaprenyl-diphosphatase